MKKVLFINMFGHGHVNPTIGLVKELISRGDLVTYIAGDEFKEKIEKTGAKFLGHKTISQHMNGNLNQEMKKPQFEAIGKMKEVLEEIIEIALNSEEKYDYIVYDSVFIAGNELGRILKIPTICSITTFAMNDKINVLWSTI